MKTLRVVEVRDSQLRGWAKALPLDEAIPLNPEAYNDRWSAWTMAMNWLARNGIRLVGVLGSIGPLDEDRKALLVIESDQMPPKPPFAT